MGLAILMFLIGVGVVMGGYALVATDARGRLFAETDLADVEPGRDMTDSGIVKRFLDAVAQAIGNAKVEGIKLAGPAPAPVSRIKNLYRFHLRLQAPTARPIQDVLKAILPTVHPPGEVELAVDVDPVSLL